MPPPMLWTMSEQTTRPLTGPKRREAEPAGSRWKSLRERAINLGLVGSALSSGRQDVSATRGHVNLVQAAQSQQAVLLERLERAQEGDLRGESEDIAGSIEVQRCKARGQANRLNQNLRNISFGSIRGIQVRQVTVDRMEKALHAFRDKNAQALLFKPTYGGGRNGGYRLLDYREYVHLQVEIRREASGDWEIANPTKLSTGEAIGVGASLMMVILTEWESDTTLRRGKKSHGSLRFLFLDEANRLSGCAERSTCNSSSPPPKWRARKAIRPTGSCAASPRAAWRRFSSAAGARG